MNEYHNLEFTVRLSRAIDQPVSFQLATATPAGYATSGKDYVFKQQNFTLAPGQVSATFVVDVIHDQLLDEQPEPMRVIMDAVSGAPIADNVAWGTTYEVDFLS